MSHTGFSLLDKGAISCPSFLSGEALVNGLDKGAGDPRLRAVLGLIGFGRSRLFYLSARLALLDQIRDHVADDHHHVAVIHHVQLLAHPPMAWNHVCSDSL